jgi:hypothetical protein
VGGGKKQVNYKSKYIIVVQGAMVYPVVFGDLLGHNDIARSFNRDFIVSAGFCYINETGEYACYGESVTLKLKSRPEDSAILNKYLGVSPEEY